MNFHHNRNQPSEGSPAFAELHEGSYQRVRIYYRRMHIVVRGEIQIQKSSSECWGSEDLWREESNHHPSVRCRFSASRGPLHDRNFQSRLSASSPLNFTTTEKALTNQSRRSEPFTLDDCGAGCLPVSFWMTDHSSRSLVLTLLTLPSLITWSVPPLRTGGFTTQRK